MTDTSMSIPSSARPCEGTATQVARPPKVIRSSKGDTSVSLWTLHGEWVKDTRLNG